MCIYIMSGDKADPKLYLIMDICRYECKKYRDTFYYLDILYKESLYGGIFLLRDTR